MNIKPYIITAAVVMTFFACFPACGPTGPRNQEQARKAAIRYFEDDMFELDIDHKLFQGPVLILENDAVYRFQWQSKVPKLGATIIEISVPKDPGEIKGMYIGGSREEIGYLRGTRKLPLNEAMLSTLFGTAPTPKDNSKRAKRLRMVALDTMQMEDIANFVIIGHELMNYSYCFAGHNPDSLEQIKNFARAGCAVDSLDSIYTLDRYSRKYYYENLIEFVLLGTKGIDDKWAFSDAVMDSVYNDHLEHIYVCGEDIIVKLNPLH